MAINLLLSDIREKRRKERQVSLMMLGATSLIFVMVVTYVAFYLILQRQEAQLAKLKTDLSNVNNEIALYKTYEEREAELQKRKGLVETSIAGEIAWDRLLNDISMVIPVNVWLTSLSVSLEKGLAVMGYTYDFPSVAQWLIMNDKITILGDVWLNEAVKVEIEGQPIIQFSSKARVENGLPVTSKAGLVQPQPAGSSG